MIIERGRNIDKKKGLTAYSQYGTGTCFSFYINGGDYCEKLENIKKESSSSEIHVSTIKKLKESLNSSSEDKFLSFTSKEGFLTISLLNENEGAKNLKNHENHLRPVKEKNSLKFPVSGTDEIASSRSIFLKKQEVEEKRLPAKFFVQEGTNNSISLGTIGKMDSSVQLKINNMKCSCVKILIVDDVTFNIEVCRRLLKKMNFEADCAFNGLDAVEKVKSLLNSALNNGSNKKDKNQNVMSNKTERKFCEKCNFYKIILMDIDMPIKDGIEATQEILEILGKFDILVSIIGLSAFDQEQVKNKAMSAGMKKYMTKPITFKKMNEIILNYI